MPSFRVQSDFAPAGDQPNAIDALAHGVERGDRFQTLLGITGSGKSATIAWTIEKVQRPTLVIAPNKSLAAQASREERRRLADLVIDNTGSRAHLEAEVERAWKWIESLRAEGRDGDAEPPASGGSPR